MTGQVINKQEVGNYTRPRMSEEGSNQGTQGQTARSAPTGTVAVKV